MALVVFDLAYFKLPGNPFSKIAIQFFSGIFAKTKDPGFLTMLKPGFFLPNKNYQDNDESCYRVGNQNSSHKIVCSSEAFVKFNFTSN